MKIENVTYGLYERHGSASLLFLFLLFLYVLATLLIKYNKHYTGGSTQHAGWH